MTSVSRALARSVVAGLAIAACVAASAEPRRATLPAAHLASSTLEAVVFEARGPVRGAAVLLHGCGGPGTSRGLDERFERTARMLAERGLRVAVPDSFGSRGLGSICSTPPERRTIRSRDRVADAHATLDWLRAALPDPASPVILVGWSHGGSTALDVLDAADADRRAGRFDSVVMFYPGCAAALDRRPAFRPSVPSLMLLGEADDWTPAAPCVELAARHAGSPAPMQAVVYPGAFHNFDGTRPVRVRRDVTHGPNGSAGVHVGADPAARDDATRRLTGWVDTRLAAPRPGEPRAAAAQAGASLPEPLR